MINILKNITKNKVILYLISRYATYAIQFISSMVIASKLGPYYMGVWGVVLLIFQYFLQLHFGIPHSFNVLYVQNCNNSKQCDCIISNSFILITYLCCITLILFTIYNLFDINIESKYNIDKYLIYILIIVILQFYQLFFINLLRVKNKLNAVAFCQSIVVILNFGVIFIFNGETLILHLILGYLIGYSLCFIVTILTVGFPKINLQNFSFELQKIITKKGIFLFIYNSCFGLIIISDRTFISTAFSVEDFGIFTFAFTLAHAFLLLLDSLAFVVFPKIIGKLSYETSDKTFQSISKYRVCYVTSAHIIIYVAFLIFPIIVNYFDKYHNALIVIYFIALTILTQTCTCGYTELMIAQNKEKKLACFSAFGLIINCIIVSCLIYIFNVDYCYVILGTMITYLIYSIIIVYNGTKLIKKLNFIELVKLTFPTRLFIPFGVALLICIFEIKYLIFLPLLLLLLLNFNDIKIIYEMCISLIKNPKIFNL